jgi:hypothetical protein
MRKPPDGKIVAQVHYASRLLASQQTGLHSVDFTPGIRADKVKIVIKITIFKAIERFERK